MCMYWVRQKLQQFLYIFRPILWRQLSHDSETFPGMENSQNLGPLTFQSWPVISILDYWLRILDYWLKIIDQWSQILTTDCEFLTTDCEFLTTDREFLPSDWKFLTSDLKSWLLIANSWLLIENSWLVIASSWRDILLFTYFCPLRRPIQNGLNDSHRRF